MSAAAWRQVIHNQAVSGRQHEFGLLRRRLQVLIGTSGARMKSDSALLILLRTVQA